MADALSFSVDTFIFSVRLELNDFSMHVALQLGCRGFDLGEFALYVCLR